MSEPVPLAAADAAAASPLLPSSGTVDGLLPSEAAAEVATWAGAEVVGSFSRSSACVIQSR